MAFDTLDDLVGRKVLGVSLNEERDAIVFQADEGDFVYDAEGDCCSVSWFEHATGFEALLGETVLEAQVIDMPEPPEDPERDCVQAYGYRLVTSKGWFELEMRNESNGYYGGSLERRTGPYYRWKGEATPVTADF